MLPVHVRSPFVYLYHLFLTLVWSPLFRASGVHVLCIKERSPGSFLWSVHSTSIHSIIHTISMHTAPTNSIHTPSIHINSSRTQHPYTTYPHAVPCAQASTHSTRTKRSRIIFTLTASTSNTRFRKTQKSLINDPKQPNICHNALHMPKPSYLCFQFRCSITNWKRHSGSSEYPRRWKLPCQPF